MEVATQERKTIDLFVSDKLKNLLCKFSRESVIANTLLCSRIHKDDLVENPINYLSISDADAGRISYLTPDRIDGIEKSSTDDYWTTSKRYHCKPGSFVSKLFKNSSPKDIEVFSNLYKSYVKFFDFKFKIFEGEEIRKHYYYEKYLTQSGTLGNSCMKSPNCQSYLDIYITNNDNIKILVMLNKDNFVIGRALLWSCGDFKIMDRIYTIKDEEYQTSFKDWATENNYLYKSKQNYASTTFFENKEIASHELFLTIKLQNTIHNYYPYVDTFKWLDVEKSELSNYKPAYFTSNKDKFKVLVCADGRHVEGDYLSMCEMTKDWFYKNEVRYLEYKKMWVWINNCF